LTLGCTLIEPCRTIYGRLTAMEKGLAQRRTLAGLSVAVGFGPADVADCGPSVLAYAEDQETADGAAEELATLLRQSEHRFRPDWVSPEEAMERAIRVCRQRPGAGPVILADAQDNPGAGANADTIGLLRALLAVDGCRVALGILYDPQAAAEAHSAGLGATIDIGLGAKSDGAPGERPLRYAYRVEALSDGQVHATGPFMGGSVVSLGPTALLRAGHVQIVVGSRKVQCADRTLFTHVGVDVAVLDIVAVKSAVHFRADFDAIATETIIVASPGPGLLDHTSFRYRHVRATTRVMPQTKGQSL
jgi:microcystin degradation protein MlrC